MAETPPSRDEINGAHVVRRHLPEGYSATFDGQASEQDDGANGPSASAPDLTQPPSAESSLKLQGGDLHRDLYKLDARARTQNRMPQRSATFSHPSPRPHRRLSTPIHEGTVSEQQAPGGFRREYLARHHRRFQSVTAPVTSSFVEFLALYGSFAGEDLAESDDESGFTDDDTEDAESGQPDEPGERRPLLGRRKSSRVPRKGDASLTKSFFTLLKAFIGTGIMFLPKAFNNGGMLFSAITLVSVSVISCIAFHLLLKCRARYGGGYGEIGEAIGGPRFRSVILASITISQLGFVCSGMIFTAENMNSFLDAVIKGRTVLSTNALIALQLIVLIPLALIRNISKLGPVALVADLFIALGLTYIYYYDISTISSQGIHPTVQLFNPVHYTLTVGAAIFTFEGIGLILPIQSSMAQPEKFGPLLYVVMVIITIIFTSVGVLCYATFGAGTQTEVISNFPQTSKLVNTIQFLYACAVLIGTPVQLFPAVRIVEGALFGHRSGKQSTRTKWRKNAFRTAVVGLCCVIAILGASDLDKFVALIGSFACVPLVYIYPALLHFKGIAESKVVKAGDVLLMVGGAVAMVYTTCITLVRWSQE